MFEGAIQGRRANGTTGLHLACTLSWQFALFDTALQEDLLKAMQTVKPLPLLEDIPNMDAMFEICFPEQLENCATINNAVVTLSLSGNAIFSQTQPELDMINTSNR